jgi:hypothetical protein
LAQEALVNWEGHTSRLRQTGAHVDRKRLANLQNKKEITEAHASGGHETKWEISFLN